MCIFRLLSNTLIYACLCLKGHHQPLGTRHLTYFRLCALPIYMEMHRGAEQAQEGIR